MQDPASSHDDLSELERQLAALAPIGGVDRDRLMYAAGRRAGQRHLRATQRWLAVTSAGFGAVLAFTVLNPRLPVDKQPDAAPGIAQQPAREAAHRLAIRSERMSRDPDSNFRLLQQLASGAMLESTRSQDSGATSDAALPDAPRSDARWLLNRYLDEARTKL
jgi:hypothetical protein